MRFTMASTARVLQRLLAEPIVFGSQGNPPDFQRGRLLIPLTRRRVGLGFFSVMLTHCTTRSAMRTSESTPGGPSEHTEPARKLRILCLHGYHGSARALRSQ